MSDRWRTVYKLTDRDGRTWNATQWGPGVTNPRGVLSGAGDLCTGAFYHAYHTAELAAFLNPLGAAFDAATCLFWEAAVRGKIVEDRGILKLGSTEMRTIREIAPLRPTIRQRVAFGILVASAVLDLRGQHIPAFQDWSARWLDGEQGTAVEAAWAAAAARAAAVEAARAAARAAAEAADWAAVGAAWAAAAARAAAEAADWAANTSRPEVSALVCDAAVLALAESWEPITCGGLTR